MEYREIELANCNYVKTILMLIVVFYHSIVFWTGSWFILEPAKQSILLQYLAIWLNSFHIYAFTFISGYVFYYCKYEKYSYTNFRIFVLKKLKRLILPYVLISIFYVIPITNIFFRFSWEEILNYYILGRRPNQLWFLLMLFNVFIIFYLISDFILKHRFLGLILVFLFYIVGSVLGHFIPNYFNIETSLKYLLFFYLGFSLRKSERCIFRRISFCIYIIVDIVLFIIFIINKNFLGISFIEKILTLLLNIVGSYMAFFTLNKLRYDFDNNILKKLSDNSMAIYLFHQQIIYVSIYFFNGKIFVPVFVALNFIVSLIISLLISECIKRFKLGRLMVGEI